MRDHGVESRERAESFLSRHHYTGGECGKASGGAIAHEAKKIVTKALREHENAEHGGKHERLKLKSGGRVHGKHSEHRPDRRRRAEGGSTEELRRDEGEHEYSGHMKAESDRESGETEGRARGGRHGGEHGKGKIGAVNIAIGNPEKEQMAKQQGLQAGLQAGIQKGVMAARAGAGGPPPGAGGPPPGAPPPRPPMAGPPGGGMPPPGAIPGGAMPPGAGAPPGAMMARPPGAKRGGEIKVREHHRRRAGGGV